MTVADLLEQVFLDALRRCDPRDATRHLLRAAALRPGPVDLFAAGKCAAALCDAATETLEVGRALVVVPRGYPLPQSVPVGAVAEGGHPGMDEASFEAGNRALEFFRSSRRPVVALVSGGASACMESPLAPWFERGDLVEVNAALVRSGLPIGSMNVVRRHLSAIKGGRLASAAPSPVTTFVYSDVARGRLADVGSGPTLADPSGNRDAAELLDRLSFTRLAEILRDPALPETPKRLDGDAHLIADNDSLVDAAAAALRDRGLPFVRLPEPLERGVDEEAAELLERLAALPPGHCLVAGGEPVVRVTGEGRGGRCSELAARLLLASPAHLRFTGLFAGSDGLDGNSGAAGVLFSSDARPGREALEDAIGRSDTFPMMRETGRPIMIPPTGNNLRDLFLLART